jgi:hypothetical protein
MNIIQARTPHEINEVRSLFREYEAYLNVDLCFQQFESELANLPGKYAPPSGTLLLAKDKQKAVGCGALRRLGAIQDRTCEMKRLYVCPEGRGVWVLVKKSPDGLFRKAFALAIPQWSLIHLIGWMLLYIFTNHWALCARNLTMTIRCRMSFIGNWI